MAYQNVGTPRFYVNIFEYLSAIGYTDIIDVYRLNPTQYKSNTDDDASRVYYPSGIFTDKSYIAYLGHQGGKLTNSYNFNNNIIINADLYTGQTNELSPEYEGFSIRSLDLSSTTYNATYCVNPIGSISVGTYYDMPHSPDLSLKLSYEYDGIKTQQTKGGATLSNALYTKPADWGDYGAWQLGNNSDSANYDFSKNYRSGRKVWDLSFSYLNSSDIMPSNATTNNLYSASDYSSDELINDFGYTSDDIQTATTNNGAFRENILTSNDFFSQVWNRTMGGHLPFIFQPNGNLNLADQFAICRFDMDSLQYDQVANNVYNVKLKIREVW